MQTTLRISILSAALLLGGTVSTLHAQEPRNLDLFRSQSYSLHENMDELLRLTPEQSAKLNEAREKRLNDPELLAAHEAFKASQSNENKGAFYKAQKTTSVAYREVVESTLTTEQKELIDKVSDFAKTVWDDLDEITHWGERMRKMKEIGPERLKEILTPEQLAILGVGNAAPDSAPQPEAAPEPKAAPAPPRDTSADL